MISWIDIALIPFSVFLLLIVLAVTQKAGDIFGLRPELQRKIVHVLTGSYALVIPFAFQNRSVFLAFTGLSLIVLLLLRLPVFSKEGVSSAIHSVERKSYGEVYLTIAVGLIFWFSDGQMVLYVLPLLVLTLSDTAAALAGTRYGSKHFEVNSGAKSWEGVTVFFLVTWIIALILLLLMTDIAPPNIVTLSFIIAAFSALVEADSWNGLDNLFVPMCIYLLLSSHMNTPPMQLLLLAAIFILALRIMVLLGYRIGMKRYISRAYVTFILMVCLTTARHNALLPALMLAAHIIASLCQSDRNADQDLSLLAFSTGISLFWLFIGDYAGYNALNSYNLTFAAMAMLFITLATCHYQLWIRLVVSFLGVGLLGILVLFTAKQNAFATGDHNYLFVWVFVSLILSAAAGLVIPQLFRVQKSFRVFLASFPLPLLLYIS